MKRSAKVLPQDFLFEIGTEELPATNLADLFETAAAEGVDNMLEARFKKALEDKRLSFGSARVWATPRRLVFFAQGVPPVQAAKENLLRVLSKDEAYAGEAPTEKFLTILKHRKASLQETVVEDWNGKPYVFIKKSEPAQKTEAVLPELCRALVKSLAFPKNMKWGDRWEDGGELYFPRPIRHYLCFYGKRPLSFKIAGRAVAGRTFIFSKSRRAAYAVRDIAAYRRLLSKRGIVIDPAERKKAIAGLLEQSAKTFRAKLYEDPFLLNEVNFLVESPDVLSASFDGEFLKLPLEVLAVSMARKQRIFGMLGADGRVLARFLAVLDGKTAAAQKKNISKNMENILRAKLQDSLFFYKEDVKLSLEKRRAQLKDLVFLKGAGSMLEKSERLVSLARELGPEAGLSSAEQTVLERAAFLSKSDLLSQMVGEFPELQGIVGRYYAKEDGETEAAALAIGEQYLPRTVQDRLPETPAGCVLSVLDKADLVAVCFRLDLEPTSSLDPYGLRRSATAVLKILVDKKINLSLTRLLGRPDAASPKLTAFFKDRFKALLADKGYREDVIEAVLASGFERPYEIFQKIEALSRVLEKDFFPRAWKVAERTVNIVKGVKETLPKAPDPAHFQEDVERRLWDSYGRSNAAISNAARSGRLEEATRLYAEAFFDILGEFFEKVFVNDKNSDIRKNRLALLWAIKELYTGTIADLSKIRLAQNV